VIGLLDVPPRERVTLLCVIRENLMYHQRPLLVWFTEQPELRELLPRGRPCWMWLTREGTRHPATDAEVASVAVLVRMGLLRAPRPESWAEQVMPTRAAVPLINWLDDQSGWLP
jgi:hypothetical protein